MTSHHEARATLTTLRDLEGVVGSFLVGPSGTVIAQDVPSFFGSATYDVGPRAQRLRDALPIGKSDSFQCVLRFGQHKLALRPVGSHLLTVVLELDTNMPALRMATNLVAKKLARQQEVRSAQPSTPPPPTVRPQAQTMRGESQSARRGSGAPEAAGAHSPKTRAIFYRGKRIS